jgi:hypothetical protein
MNKSAQEQRQSKSIPGAGSHREQEHTRTKAYRHPEQEHTQSTSAHRARAHQEKEHTGAQAENKSTVIAGAHQGKKSIQEHSQSSSTYRESRTTPRAGERA